MKTQDLLLVVAVLGGALLIARSGVSANQKVLQLPAETPAQKKDLFDVAADAFRGLVNDVNWGK